MKKLSRLILNITCLIPTFVTKSIMFPYHRDRKTHMLFYRPGAIKLIKTIEDKNIILGHDPRRFLVPFSDSEFNKWKDNWTIRAEITPEEIKEALANGKKRNKMVANEFKKQEEARKRGEDYVPMAGLEGTHERKAPDFLSPEQVTFIQFLCKHNLDTEIMAAFGLTKKQLEAIKKIQKKKIKKAQEKVQKLTKKFEKAIAKQNFTVPD